MGSMKTATTVLSYPPKRYIGAEKMDHAIHLELLRRGHDTRVFAKDHQSKKWEYQGIPVNHPTDSVDLVIGHIDAQAWQYQAFYELQAKKQVAIQHNLTNDTSLRERMYQQDMMIYNSEYMLSIGRNQAPVKTVLRPPIAMPNVPLSKGDKVTIINLAPVKASGFWAWALQMPDVEFQAVVGGWGEQQIWKPDLPNVKVIPQTSNLVPVWKETKVLLMPSQFESWGMVASEALRYGIHTITCDHLPGVKENLGDTAIYLERENNDPAWMDAILNAPKPSQSAQNRAKELYAMHKSDLQNVVTEMENLL